MFTKTSLKLVKYCQYRGISLFWGGGWHVEWWDLNIDWQLSRNTTSKSKLKQLLPWFQVSHGMSPAKNVQLSRAMRALGRQFVHLPPGQEKNLAGPPYSKEMLRPWHAELHTCKVAKLMELCSNLLSTSNLSLSIALPRRFKYQYTTQVFFTMCLLLHPWISEEPHHRIHIIL